MLRRAQMNSNIDDKMNLLPVSLKASCPNLRRSFRSLCSPDVMCDLRRHMVPHEGLGSAPPQPHGMVVSQQRLLPCSPAA